MTDLANSKQKQTSRSPHEQGEERVLPASPAAPRPRYLELLYATARTANAAESAEAAVRDIIDLVLDATGWSVGRAYLRVRADSAGGRWLVIAAGAPALPPEFGAAATNTAIGPAERGLAAAALAAATVRCESADTAGPAGLRCGCAVPILLAGADVGVIEFYSDRPVRVDAALREALTEIADQLARVIGRGRAQRAGLRQQEYLAQTGRLASLRELARNLAHEVNQPLAAVVGYAGGALQLLEQGRADEDKMRRALEQVGIQAKRASGIIQEFREFLRGEEARHEPLDLPSLIADAVALTADAAHEAGVSMHIDLPANPPRVLGDPVQLQQVLINLIQNAIESMSPPEVAERRLDVTADVIDQLEIRIRDTGTGMAPELVPQLFTPFLTTKQHGLGMGLPISRSIVELHGGRLSGENNDSGGGMTFRIRLPLARP